MPVEAACPSCEGKFRLPDAAAGKRIKCPKCKGPLDVPALGAPVAEPAPAVVSSAPPAEGLKGAWRSAPQTPVAPEPPRAEVPKPQALAPKPEPVKSVAPKPAEQKPTFQMPPEKKPAAKVELKPEKKAVESGRLKPELQLKPEVQQAVEKWFLRGDGGETFGPVDRPTLDAWHDEGRMTGDSQLLKQGTDQWQWASDVYPDLEEPEPAPEPPPAAPSAAAGSSIHRDELEPASSSRLGSASRPSARDEAEDEPDTGERLSPHSKPVAFLLALTLGMFGIHRFYLGYVGIGLAMFFTFGGLLMWSLTDALRILFGHVTDSEGLKLRD